MEPLTLEYVAKILRFERPDAILPGLGGQTGLNLAMRLHTKGVLEECQVEILGTSFDSINKAEDRDEFKKLCQSLGEPVLPSVIATTLEEGKQAAEDIGYPVILRPAFTLGGTGGGFADNEEELLPLMKNALKLSPVNQVLVEKSIKGYKEIEYEVMRDANDTAITVCNMENLDPVGVHTGDSIVVCPSQTLTNKEYHMLRDSALKDHPRAENRGRLQHPVRAGPRQLPVLPHRGQPAREPFLRAGQQGQRLPHRARIGQDRRRPASGRNPARQHPRELRARA